MSVKSPEAAKLRSLMTSMRVSDLPKPGELHEAHTDFMPFSHRTFSNVYQSIKKQMIDSHESVPPDSDEEEGEFAVMMKIFINLAVYSPFPLSNTCPYKTTTLLTTRKNS